MNEPAATHRREEAKNTFTRADLIAEARSWIGTPWRHQAAVKGVGADCVGFVRGAAEPFVGKMPLAIDYTTTWQLYRAEPRMYREFAARCEEVPLDRIEPGDILLFGFGKGPAHHCGYAAPGGRIIHCYREAGAVVEQDLTDWWRRKLRHAFRVPGMRELNRIHDAGGAYPAVAYWRTLDVRDLRSLIDCIRFVRRTAVQTAVRLITTGILLALLAGIANKVKLFGNRP